MESISWKKVGLIILAIFLLLYRNQIRVFLEECRLKDLVIDSLDYLWTLSQGLRFALVAAFFLMLFVAAFRILMKNHSDRELFK